jgi:hypothetical protein
MFYGFAEVAEWRAFQHLDQIREPLKTVDATHPSQPSAFLYI